MVTCKFGSRKRISLMLTGVYLLSIFGVVFAGTGAPKIAVAAAPSSCEWTWKAVPHETQPGNSSVLAVSIDRQGGVWSAGKQVLHRDVNEWSVALAERGVNYRDVEAVTAKNVYVLSDRVQHWNGNDWQPVGNMPAITGADFSALAVVSNNNIWVIGQTSINGTLQPLSLHWDGVRWTKVKVPGKGYLSSIAAISANDIWAVGYNITHWNGSTWEVIRNAGDFTRLTDVKAPAANDVWVVGDSSATDHSGTHTTSTALHWDGNAWHSLPSMQSVIFEAVAPVTASNAWAVGEGIYPLWHWDGQSWTGFADHTQIGEHEFYRDIEAQNENNIWAVGTSPSLQPIAQHWGGVDWKLEQLPNTVPVWNFLAGVKALNTNSLIAVGHSSGYIRPLVERFDGSQWTVEHLPFSNNQLSAVDATSTSDIWATAQGYSELIHYDGAAWSQVNVITDVLISLNAVAALATNNAWAVGNTQETVDQSVIVHWNGTQWSRTTTPHDSNALETLNSVTAVSPNDIWAVGFESFGTSGNALALHWDGSTWTKVEVPDSSKKVLRAVSARSSNDVWAVGDGAGQVFHWDGSQWQKVKTGLRGEFTAVLTGGASDVWAFGNGPDANGKTTALAAHWDGQKWSGQLLGNEGTYYYGAAMTAPDRIYAVGLDNRTSLIAEGTCK